MSDLPKNEYRLVKRGNKYRVERTGQQAVSALRLPTITQLKDRVRDFGLDRFHNVLNPEMTEDGYALLRADQLSHLVKLDARSDDLYYISPNQQVMLGFMTLGPPAIILLMLAMFLLGFSSLGLFLMPIIAALGGYYLYFGVRIEDLHSQRYAPAPAEDSPAGE